MPAISPTAIPDCKNDIASVRRGSSWFSLYLLFVLSGTVLGGCSLHRIFAQLDTAPREVAPEWREAHFFIQWPEGEPPSWHVDAMVANEVVKPVLMPELGQIRLWRFHRRAVRDDTGHRFRFLFYAPPDAAGRIFENLRLQPALIELQRGGRVMRVDFVDAPDQTIAEATSDPHWPVELQRSWPYYIMGVSQMWLDLLQQVAARRGDGPRDEALYRRVHEDVTGLWRTWGRHAWLHHLNALYAYQPLQIDRERLERF